MCSRCWISDACPLFLCEVILMFDNPYNPYNPYGFPAPFGGINSAQPQFTPQTMTQPMQMPKPAQSGPDWIQAPTIKHVEQVQVAPGGKAWVMVQNEPVFALRMADQMGLVTTDYYRFEKIDPTVEVGTTKYVTREEFEQFVSSLSTPRRSTKKEEPAE